MHPLGHQAINHTDFTHLKHLMSHISIKWGRQLLRRVQLLWPSDFNDAGTDRPGENDRPLYEQQSVLLQVLMCRLNAGSCVNRTSLTLKIWCHVCLNKLRKEWFHEPYREEIKHTIHHIASATCWGETEPKSMFRLMTDALIFSPCMQIWEAGFLKNLTVYLWPLLCLYVGKLQHLLYNLTMFCAHSGFASHLIVWLWYAAGVSPGSNWTKRWQTQTSSPAVGPYVVYRSRSPSPGLAPYTRALHSQRPDGERDRWTKMLSAHSFWMFSTVTSKTLQRQREDWVEDRLSLDAKKW